MTVYAMRKGTSPNPTIEATIGDSDNNVNYDCPTNPLFIDTATLGDTYRMFTYVSTDASHSATFVQQLQGSDASGTQYNNLSNTEGYKIKCYDDLNATGIRLNALTTSELETNDYYVLINSDNGLTHHMAKITEVRNDDILGDSFEFEPRLGKQIPKDTKFMVFKGATVATTSIVAVSAGIRATEISNGTSTYRMNKSLICAPPLFYFYNDRLDKKNELDHDTKYYIKYDADTLASSATISSFATNCFITTQDFNLSITDYSKFTMKANLIDKLRELDDPRNSLVSNEGLSLPTTDFTDYNDCFYNTRRDSDDVVHSIGNLIITGPYRYVSYNYSPAKTNDAPNLIDVSIFESIGGKGGYAEATIVDVLRIMPSKVKEFDNFRVRHQLHRGHFNEFFALKATVKTIVTGTSYLFNTDYDLATLLAVGDEVLVGDKILTITQMYSFDSAALTQGITFGVYYRLETQSVFTTSYTLSADDRLYRRAWSQSKGTLLTTFPIIENRNTNVKILLLNPNYEMLEATVTSSNVDQKTLTLSFDDVGYATTSALDHVTGDYILEIERFEGEIEQIDVEREYGQNYMKLFGRDSYSKLISPIINKNTLFSQDIIYSSNSPHNSLTEITGNATVTFNSLDIATANSLSFTNGDNVYLKYSNGVIAYIGEVNTITPVSLSPAVAGKITLKEKPLVSGVGVLQKTTNKNYMFNKALSSNNRLSNTTTSLGGSAEKGLFFESGINILDDSILAGTSQSTLNEKANGYHIHHPNGIGKAEHFQARLSDGESSFATFDTVNTLMDFTVLNKSTVDGKTTIEIAPYIPLTLGRMENNYADTYDLTLTQAGVAATTSTIDHQDNQRYIEIVASGSAIYSTGGRTQIKDPIYVEGVFVGYCTNIMKITLTHANVRIYLDRSVVYTTGDIVQILAKTTASGYVTNAKKTQELYLVNGEHLHGGKYVSLVHPTYGNFIGGSPTTLHFNTLTFSSTALTTIEKYGVPLYKINHIEKGNYNYANRIVTKQTSQSTPSSEITNYYDNPSKIGYYASAYKTNQGDTTIKNSGLIESAHPHLPIENRGSNPASGSLYFDYNVFESGHSKDITFTSPLPDDIATADIGYNNYLIKDLLHHHDPSVARLFLFATSDLMPYSSNRTDSLFNSNRDLTKLKLLLLNEESQDDFSSEQSDVLGSGSSKKYLDSTYQDSKILEVDVDDITKMKRMGIMRLTELVFDSAFNQFNPEQPPPKSKSLPITPYYSYSFAAIGGGGKRIASHGSSSITVNANVTLAQGDLIVGSNGLFIGKVASAISGVTLIPLEDAPIPNLDSSGSEFDTDLYIATPYVTELRGHGKGHTFVNFDKEINLLKSMVHTDTYTTASLETKFGDVFNAPNNVTRTAWAKSSLVLPISFNGPNYIGNAITGHTSLLLKQLDKLNLSNAGSAGSHYNFLSNSIHGVFLGRFATEVTDSTSRTEITAGTTFPPIDNAHIRPYSKTISSVTVSGSEVVTVGDTTLLEENMLVTGTGVPTGSYIVSIDPNNTTKYSLNNDATVGATNNLAYSTLSTINIGLNQEFASYKTPTGDAHTATVNDADGVMLGFKVRLLVTGTPSTINAPAGVEFFKYSVTSAAAPYLDYISDLTGTYLVSETSVEYATRTSVTSTTSLSDGINNVIPATIAYVLSHEIDTKTSTKTHIFITDYQLPAGMYRVMQPNETAFYDYSPKSIKFSTLSSEYTKMAYKKEMYSTPKDYLLVDGVGERKIGAIRNHGSSEGVLSMYVTVDLDARKTNLPTLHIVDRNSMPYTYWDSNVLPYDFPFKEGKTVCLSDGNTSFKTSLAFEYLPYGAGTSLTFDTIKEMNGIVSMSEILTITTNKNIKGNPKRALIGSVVSICDEADNLVNTLFEENDIEFTTDYNDNYPLFLAPNFKGIDLFSAINSIITNKDKQLIFEDSKFSLADKNSSASDSKILITDRTTKYQIRDFKKSDVLFDFYNEVIVYGLSEKATRQSHTSIKKRGRKTLEYDDINLITLEEVEYKANRLIQLHLGSNFKVTLEIGHQGLSQLRAGDIITLELLQENLRLAKYIILEMKHTIDGFIRMELGKYSKGLDDRFAEILAQSRLTRAKLRSNNLANNVTNVSIDTVKINEVQLLIRKREGGSVFNMGFTTTIGFTATMGFGTDGDTTTTEILRVEL